MNPVVTTIAPPEAAPPLRTVWRRLWRPAERAALPTKEDAAALHTAHAQTIFEYLYRRVGNRAEAEDICADTFAAAVTAWPRYRGAAAPRTFLLGIARNKLSDFQRRRDRRETPVSSLFDNPADWLDTIAGKSLSPEQAAEKQEARTEIRRLIAALPEAQSEAILLQYADNLTVAEIAVVMNRSADAVTSLLQRARALLYKNGRAYFAPEGEEVK